MPEPSLVLGAVELEPGGVALDPGVAAFELGPLGIAPLAPERRRLLVAVRRLFVRRRGPTVAICPFAHRRRHPTRG